KRSPGPRVMKTAPHYDGGKLNPPRSKLQQKITTKEAQTDKPLRTMLQFFDSEFKLPTLVRKEAFRDKDAMDAFLDQPVTLEKTVDSPLGPIFDMMLHKVKAKSSLRNGYLLIEREKDK